MLDFFFKILSPRLRNRIEYNQQLIDILINTGWLFVDKIVRLGMGLVVGVWIARYLGPEQFGLFSYAAAIVALFTAISTLGLNTIVVRDLVRDPGAVDLTLGSAFILQLAGGGGALIFAVAFNYLVRPDDATSLLLIVILGATMMFRSSDVIRYWFESKVISKYVVWVENFVFLLFSLCKILLIYFGAPLIAFAWVTLLEVVFVSLCFFFIYKALGGRVLDWRFDFLRARYLLKNGWPLIISGLAITFYMRIDQIILGSLFGDRAVGVYSAAARIGEVWYFIPMAIVSSVFPAMLKTREIDSDRYISDMKTLFKLMILLSLTLVAPVSFFSEWIVSLLYGEGYFDTAKVLVVYVWGGPFVFLGLVVGRWFVAENLLSHSLYRSLFGCAINVGLNFLLIPRFGPVGAAWSSVAAHAGAGVIYNVFSKKTRPVFFIQLTALTELFKFKLVWR